MKGQVKKTKLVVKKNCKIIDVVRLHSRNHHEVFRLVFCRLDLIGQFDFQFGEKSFGRFICDVLNSSGGCVYVLFCEVLNLFQFDCVLASIVHFIFVAKMSKSCVNYQSVQTKCCHFFFPLVDRY